MSSGSHFLNRKLHSLFGVIPVGAFLLVHLLTNYFAVYGRESFTQHVQTLESLPFLIVLELLFIFIPLLFHAGYGLYIAFQAKHNSNRYGFMRNHLFFWQRITGIITFIFIIWHVWQTRIHIGLNGIKPEGFYDVMVQVFHNPFMIAFYIVGVLSTTFHFSNGIWNFLVTWGITIGPRAQRISTYACLVLFVIISYIGLMAMFAFVNPVDVAAIKG
jgi:succinate dehydrogenase / fumarate reductase, cytochrome b subunit